VSGGYTVELPYPFRIIGMILGILNVVEDLGIRDKILVGTTGVIDLETELEVFGILDDIIFILLLI
jgi:hypothetical protein